MPGVTLSLKDYKDSLSEHVSDMVDYALRERARITTKPPDHRDLARRLEVEMGGATPLSRAVQSLDAEAIMDHRSDFSDITSLKVPGESRDAMWERYTRQSKIQKDLWDLEQYLDAQAEEEPRDIVAEYNEWMEKAVANTEGQAKHVAQQLTAAISRAPDFETWPAFNKDREGWVPGVYDVEVGKGSFVTPSFTLFVTDDGKITEVEDVLEGGDSDFFRSSKGQSDYFNLVNEIRHPGSSSKGRVITLYTARPTKDRERYEGARDIPSNIFLATTLDEAEGLASDLGSSEVRDVWKVRVDTRHLVKTLDTPRVKHYQTTNRTPIQDIDLIIPGRRTASLRARTIRLAWANPELRSHLVPLLKG